MFRKGAGGTFDKTVSSEPLAFAADAVPWDARSVGTSAAYLKRAWVRLRSCIVDTAKQLLSFMSESAANVMSESAANVKLFFLSIIESVSLFEYTTSGRSGG